MLRIVTKNRDASYVLVANNPDYDDDLHVTPELAPELRTLARFKAVIDPLELAIGEPFMREDIPTLFNEIFNPGYWNSGHVVLPDQNAHVLLVTLNKQGKAQDHRYLDHWIDDHTFHWQSQNATTHDSKRGREIIEHEKRGISLHLFVREANCATRRVSTPPNAARARRASPLRGLTADHGHTRTRCRCRGKDIPQLRPPPPNLVAYQPTPPAASMHPARHPLPYASVDARHHYLLRPSRRPICR